MPAKPDSKLRRDFLRLSAKLDEVDADRPLRRQTVTDYLRASKGEIKPETVFSNLTRRIEAGKQGRDLAL